MVADELQIPKAAPPNNFLLRMFSLQILSLWTIIVTFHCMNLIKIVDLVCNVDIFYVNLFAQLQPGDSNYKIMCSSGAQGKLAWVRCFTLWCTPALSIVKH